MVRGRFTGSFRSDDDYGESRTRRAGIVERRCGYCGGTGKVKEGDFIKSTVKCPIPECDEGIVRVPSNYKRCRPCKGTGKIDKGEVFPEWVHCDRCGGTGWCEPLPPYR